MDSNSRQVSEVSKYGAFSGLKKIMFADFTADNLIRLLIVR